MRYSRPCYLGPSALTYLYMCTCRCDDSSPYTSQAIERCPVIGLYPSIAYGPGNQTYMWILSTLPQSSSVYIVARNYIYKYVYIYVIIYIHMYPRLCICLTKCTFYVNSASTSFDQYRFQGNRLTSMIM